MSKHRKKEQDAAAAEAAVADAAAAAETPAEAPAAEPDPLEAARAEAARNWDLYLRERAELENFRKRTQRDKEEFRIFTRKELLLEVLPVLDNLERALEHAGRNGETQGLVEGVSMTVTQFRKVVEDFGARPITSIGAPFDANLHQAMAQAETAEQPPGTVVSEYQKGYLLQDRLLRPALVVVAKAPAAPAAETTEE
ncbi:MAG: nucleotide exchange factor GrpE [Deltaproteobacteria bacterium]|nr:MAG: nucleotide exchange factor GrpE [Deltaproteobacteria bacterium]